jgi:hypothetical protein
MRRQITLGVGLFFTLLGAIGVAAPDCPDYYCAPAQGNCLMGCPYLGLERCDVLVYTACMYDAFCGKECGNGGVVCVCHNYHLPNCLGPTYSTTFKQKPGNCSDYDCV